MLKRDCVSGKVGKESILTMMSRTVLDTLHLLCLIFLTTPRSWCCHSCFMDKKMKVQPWPVWLNWLECCSVNLNVTGSIPS